MVPGNGRLATLPPLYPQPSQHHKLENLLNVSNLPSGNQTIDQLVLVVHGVGDPPPGSTLGSFARAMGASEQPLLDERQAIWLAEKSSDPNYISTFPAHLCHLQARDQRMAIAEVYWGDLTRICHGWLGSLMGILQILFGLRYVAFAAADQPGWPAQLLKGLGRGCFRLLHGPVLAINFCLMILLFTMILLHLIGAEKWLAAGTADWIVMGCCLVAYAIASTGWRVTNTRVFERFWFWVKVNSLFLFAVLAFKFIAGNFSLMELQSLQAIDVTWYGRLFVLQLGLLWGCAIFLLQFMLVCWTMAIFDRRVYKPAIHLSLLLPALSIGIWSHLLLLVWLFVADRVSVLLQIDDLATIFAGAPALLGVQFLMSLFLGIVAGVSALQYVLWRQSSSIRKFQKGSRPPRLIVNHKVQLALGIGAAVGSALVLFIGINQFTTLPQHQGWLGKIMQNCSQIAMVAIVPISLLLGFLIPKCRPMFGIALEIVNHFVFRAKASQRRFDDEDQFDVWRTSLKNGNLYFSRREFVIQRMKRVLRHYADHPSLSSRPQLILLSHSQGTMVSIETLNDPDMAWLRDRFASINLVTMGSPFQHLYQHYFRHYYPGLESNHWQHLQSNLDFWINVFRIDDPVGTEIDFPQGFLHQSRSKPSSPQETLQPSGCINYPVGARGHVNYWNDHEVLRILRAELFFSSRDFQGIFTSENQSQRAA